MNNSFIPTHHILVDKWFSLLASQAEEEMDLEHPSFIYEVDHPQSEENPGRYFALFREDCVPQNLNPRKISFSEILHYSDKFIPVLEKFLDQTDLDSAVGNNLGSIVKSWYNLTQIASKGLSSMREKNWKRYMNRVLVWLYQTTSIFYNLKMKYLDYDKTGLYWPGNNYKYAKKIIDHFSGIQDKFVARAQSINEQVLRQALELPLNNSPLADIEIKKAYRNKMAKIHPDKNPKDIAEATRINSIYQDYQLLKEFSQAKSLVNSFNIQSLLPFENMNAA